MTKEGKPEIRNGHIQIANELYEAILSSDFTERELRVIFSIIRWTYGFNQKTRKLNYREIARYAGLKDRFSAAKACETLLEKGVIYRQKTGRRFIWGLNKYYRDWVVETTTLSGEQVENPSSQKDNTTPDTDTPLYREPITGVTLPKTQPDVVKKTTSRCQKDNIYHRAKYTLKDTLKDNKSGNKNYCRKCGGKGTVFKGNTAYPCPKCR